MNFIDQLRSLDTNDIGRWPFVFRALLIGIIFVAVTTLGVWKFVYKDRLPLLNQAQTEEKELRGTFDQKQRKAANLDAYKQQLAEMESSFGTMLRQLPGETEVPSLLVDVSQTGLAAGLQEELFQPSPEVRKDFYAELPIKIRLTGNFHELGRFVSDVAALPRIVTLHDIQIRPETPGDSAFDELVFDVTAKTYRYLEEEADGA